VGFLSMLSFGVALCSFLYSVSLSHLTAPV
jgi:hypothetical protein